MPGTHFRLVPRVTLTHLSGCPDLNGLVFNHLLHRFGSPRQVVLIAQVIETRESRGDDLDLRLEKVDLPSWCFTLPDSEYQASSPAHVSGSAY